MPRAVELGAIDRVDEAARALDALALLLEEACPEGQAGACAMAPLVRLVADHMAAARDGLGPR